MQHLDINMAEEEMMLEDEAIALEDSDKTDETDYEVSNMVDYVMSKFKKSEDYRYEDELRWVRAYRNYRGLYGPDVQFTEAEKSRVFIKVTKTKVLAAFGQLVDVIFGTGKFPIGVTETKVPEGELGQAHLDIENPSPEIETSMPDNIGNRMEDEPQGNPYDIGYEGDGRTLKAGATFGKGMFEETFEDQTSDMLVEGANPSPETLEVKPAQRAARRMEKLIHDQIEESNGSSEIRNSLLEASLLGTGIVKGPFNFLSRSSICCSTSEKCAFTSFARSCRAGGSSSARSPPTPSGRSRCGASGCAPGSSRGQPTGCRERGTPAP